MLQSMFCFEGIQTCERGAGTDDDGGIHQVQEINEGVCNGVGVLAESSVRVAVRYPHVDEAGRDVVVFPLDSFRAVTSHAFAAKGQADSRSTGREERKTTHASRRPSRMHDIRWREWQNDHHTIIQG